MKDLFLEAAANIDLPSVREWKEAGHKVIGYTCSFLPVEIFHAAHILPVRLRGINLTSMEIADTYYGPFVCTFPKSLLQLAGEGKYDFIDGAVLSTGCDGLRRLFECWRKAADEDIPGIMPDFFHYFDVPHKALPHAVSWFGEEIRKVISSIENHFDLTVSENDLHEAIVRQNRIRRLLAEIEELRAGEDEILSGADAFAVVVAGSVLPWELYAENLNNLVSELRKVKGTPEKKKRLMVIGSADDDIDFIRLIEASKARVVSENICFGIRSLHDRVSEEGDPVQALAERYLSNSVCPRMFGGYKARFAALKDKIDRARVDGVIMQNIRFCDMHGSEHGLFEKDLKALGIPSIRIEREYGPLVETGRMKMRIDAFLESIS